ncbi:acidic endochitinase-like [Neltuma alba]|uniref:acidic endochitinase-like n=1 Tax=Neltuma alba TaxID=207710 RepID=UPI0010A2F175|nr:acidic endochitinase-like [Prosopis alba]
MVSNIQGCILLLLSLLLSHFSSAKELGMVTYWGQNVREGELDEACATGNYEIVNIAFLSIFANGQSKGVKILLSLGGDSRIYSLSSAQDAKRVADYLWTNFLGGHQNNSEGLLGNAILHDIAFGIKQGGTCYYDDLAKDIDSYRMFYNNPSCQYSPWNTQDLMHSWNQWIDFPISKLYLGLPASPAPTGRAGGYIPVDGLNHEILPRIKSSPNYGGVCYGAVTMI